MVQDSPHDLIPTRRPDGFEGGGQFNVLPRTKEIKKYANEKKDNQGICKRNERKTHRAGQKMRES
jgi:hypothetical protein